MEGLPLNEQEFGVLEHAARGRTSAQTGTAMYLGDETIKTYRKRAIAKLAARNLTHAVAIAIGNGYVNVETILEEHELERSE